VIIPRKPGIGGDGENGGDGDRPRSTETLLKHSLNSHHELGIGGIPWAAEDPFPHCMSLSVLSHGFSDWPAPVGLSALYSQSQKNLNHDEPVRNRRVKQLLVLVVPRSGQCNGAVGSTTAPVPCLSLSLFPCPPFPT
jgi:hypothetical protein